MTARARCAGAAMLVALPVWLLPFGASEGRINRLTEPADIILLGPSPSRGEREALRAFDARVAGSLSGRPAAAERRLPPDRAKAIV